MKLASLLVLIAAVMVSQAFGADWEYPPGGPTGTSEHTLGKTGKFHTYHTVTKDSPEKVILWYAQKLNLKNDDELVKMAQAGFGKLEGVEQLGPNGMGRDFPTDKWGALYSATLSPKHANVHIFVRPENDSINDLTISITQTPTGTAISVIQSLPSKNTTKVAKAK